MIVSKWTAGVLETFDDEWFNIAQLHAEIESRSGQTILFNTVEAAVWRAVESGKVESRWDRAAASADSSVYGTRCQKPQMRKEYRWA